MFPHLPFVLLAGLTNVHPMLASQGMMKTNMGCEAWPLRVSEKSLKTLSQIPLCHCSNSSKAPHLIKKKKQRWNTFSLYTLSPPTSLPSASFTSSHWTSHAPTSRRSRLLFPLPGTLFPQIQSLDSYRTSLKEKPPLITQSKQCPFSCHHSPPSWMLDVLHGIAHCLTEYRFVHSLSHWVLSKWNFHESGYGHAVSSALSPVFRGGSCTEWVLNRHFLKEWLNRECNRSISSFNIGCMSPWWHSWCDSAVTSKDPGDGWGWSHPWSQFIVSHCNNDGAWTWPLGKGDREKHILYEGFPLSRFLQSTQSWLYVYFCVQKFDLTHLIISHFPPLFIQTTFPRKLICVRGGMPKLFNFSSSLFIKNPFSV